jgi:hypothetical protein
MEYPHGDHLLFMSRPDLVVADKHGTLVYIEYKTTSSKRDEWINQWDTAVQLHSSVKAIEHTLGRKVGAVVVQGLYKGYVAYSKQTSPMCYAYLRGANPPFTVGEISYDYKAGFKKSPTWELPNGVKGWVGGMSDILLSEQFPQTAPIFINDRMVDAFFKQREVRESEIQQGGDVDQVFPQNFSQCNPGWGKPCQFRQLCFGGADNPLDHGFVPRMPHHPREMEQFNGTA